MGYRLVRISDDKSVVMKETDWQERECEDCKVKYMEPDHFWGYRPICVKCLIKDEY